MQLVWVISKLCLYSVVICLIIYGAHMKILFTNKVNILVLFEKSYKSPSPPQSMLSIDPETVSIYCIRVVL